MAQSIMDVWEQSIEVTTGFSRVSTSRPYEIHQHVRDRFAGDPNDFDRVDAIMALRRAVGQRVRMLNRYISATRTTNRYEAQR
jgi:hypothetical protein